MRHPGRGGSAWRRACAIVLRDATVCALCGRLLDFDAAPRTKWSPSVDHIVPLAAMREWDEASQRRMALDPSNLRAVHYGCNSSRGAGYRRLARKRSREW